MKLQFFIGTIWGVTEILQGGGYMPENRITLYYISLDFVLMSHLILKGQRLMSPRDILLKW